MFLMINNSLQIRETDPYLYGVCRWDTRHRWKNDRRL